MARASGLTILTKLGKLGALLVVAGVLVAGILVPYVGGLGLVAKSGADKFLDTTCDLTEEPVQQKTTVYASDGTTVIAQLFDQNRQVISIKQVPQPVINALVSTEDRRFFQHHGVDVRGLIRAAVSNGSGSSDTQGASTLTEQYVKQVKYYDAVSAGNMAAAQAAIDQTIDRKLADAQCALQIEKKYTKQQILEKYLNIAFFGENAYGIQTAAQVYFGESASKLTVPQAALLVGLVRDPTNYDPYNNLDNARVRRNVVLQNMVTSHYLTQAQADAYKAAPIKLIKQEPVKRGCAYANPNILNAGFFCDYAVQWLAANSGLSTVKVNTGGLKIVTTLDVNLQNQGERAIWSQSGLNPSKSGGYILAMPSVNPQNGEVTSMITDLHYGVRAGNAGYSVLPVFTDAYAGSGSTYKYFTALAALKSGVPPNFGVYTPQPYRTTNCAAAPPSGGYVNAGSYRSFYPLNQALPLSSNTYFVGMEDQFFDCNLAPIVNTATGLGMTALLRKDPNDALGRTYAQATIQDQQATFTLGQTGTSALQLTSAIGTVANGGVYCPPTPIKSISDVNGNPLDYKKVGCSRQYSPFVAATLVNIMTNDTNPSGTGGTATSFFGSWYANGGSLVVGKTGTDNAVDPITHEDNGKNSALWFVGVTPTLASAAALVNPDSPNKTIANVPGVTEFNDGSDTFGATASQFWLEAFGPTLQGQHWQWPTVDSLPGDTIPQYQVVGQTVDQARANLEALGYKVSVDSWKCASSVTYGNVAYFSPWKAVPGDTVSVCTSTGQGVLAQPVAPTPTKRAPSAGRTSRGGTGNGGGQTSTGRGGHNGGGPPPRQ